MTCDYRTLPHPGIQTLSPYIPGKSAEALFKEKGLLDVIKLASNENPYGCSPQVLEALAGLTGLQLATYCTSQAHPLREALASALHTSVDTLVLANGSDTLFSLLMTCFALQQDKHVLTHEFAFITFPIQAQTLGIPVVTTPMRKDWQPDIDAMIQVCTEKTALIYIANPNNPTGGFISSQDIQRLLEHIPKSTILILDEAYYEYLPEGHTSFADKLSVYPNVVITRTFSKAYGLAGLRLGYAMGHPEIISLLLRIQLPFMINVATLTAGMAALNDMSFVHSSVQHNMAGIQQMTQGFDALCIDYLPAWGNFVTFDCKQDAMSIYLKLQDNGIIVRPLHAYGLNNYLRVSIGTSQQIKRFLDTLPSCLPPLIRNAHE